MDGNPVKDKDLLDLINSTNHTNYPNIEKALEKVKNAELQTILLLDLWSMGKHAENMNRDHRA